MCTGLLGGARKTISAGPFHRSRYVGARVCACLPATHVRVTCRANCVHGVSADRTLTLWLIERAGCTLLGVVVCGTCLNGVLVCLSAVVQTDASPFQVVKFRKPKQFDAPGDGQGAPSKSCTFLGNCDCEDCRGGN